jgi:DNA sulfur modification protein DndD
VLAIRSITLTDFGPFKDEQRIEFPADNGVSIIYGENMRGKTTLLNAIRYALFGKVLTRGAAPVALHQIGNWETAKEKGKYGFKVVLEFEHEGSKYELTREHRPRSGVTHPQTDFDYQQDCYLRKDGTVLGPEQRDSEIARIMPETVSRFFLFDGELLQQYEELLRNESEMGRNIKEAIERILGVPVLTNGRSDFSELAKEAQKREAKAAQKNQKTQSLGNQQQALITQREGLQAETDRLKKELDTARASKASKEEELKKTERTKALLDDRVRLQEEISGAETRLKEKEEKHKELLTVAWKGLLTARIRSTREALQTELEGLRDTHRKAVVTEDLSEKLRTALSAGECSTCGQALGAEAKERIGKLVAESMPKEERQKLEAAIQNLETRIAALRQSEGASNADLLQEVQDAIDDLKIKKAAAEDRLSDIREQTQGLDEAEVRKLYGDYEKTLTDIGLLQKGIENSDQALAVKNEQIANVAAEMAKFADADLESERARKELCEKLKAMFSEAVDAYRERLRAKVEKDATALFTQLTSEPEYKGLSINESYGLTIVHQDGSEIPVRSAGAEHIVALSLMGALQRNAPLRGPIVMDSPFGRLDEAHTTKVVQSLPNMASQVMLLVYESELDPKDVRNQLKGKLKKEYRIGRRSARHSVVESVA